MTDLDLMTGINGLVSKLCDKKCPNTNNASRRQPFKPIKQNLQFKQQKQFLHIFVHTYNFGRFKDIILRQILHINKMLGDDTRQQNLLVQMDDHLAVPATDKIFHQAFQYFNICSWVILIYTGGKIIVTPFIIINSEKLQFTLFLILLFLVSLLEIVFHLRVKRASKNVSLYYEIAEETGHLAYVPPNQVLESSSNSDHRIVDIYDFTDNEPAEDERKMKLLSGQIKQFIQGSSEIIQILHKLQFAGYQIVHFWGLLLLLKFQFPDQTSSNFVAVILLFGTYQYLQFYIFVVFFIIITPIYALKQLYKYLLNRYKAYKLQRALKIRSFSDDIKGDHECKICLMPYQQNDRIIVLQCSELHHFHASCFNQWINCSFTCPLCRIDITSN